MTAGLPVQACDFCGEPIIWAITRNAARIPVDAEPVAGANILLTPRTGIEPSARILSPGKQFGLTTDAQGRPRLRKHHKLTCKQARRWAGGR